MRSTRSLGVQRQTGLQGGAARRCLLPRSGRTYAVASPAAAAVEVEDKWISRMVKSAEGPTAQRLLALNDKSLGTLASIRLPTTRAEEYRFTDVSPLLKASVQVSSAGAAVDAGLVSSQVFPEAASSYALVVDGVFRAELSQLGGLPAGTYVGGIAGAPAAAAQALGSLSGARGGPFATINGSVARDALCVVVPANAEIEAPIYVLYITSGGASADLLAGAAPRLLLHAGKASICEVVEEFVGGDAGNGHYLNMPVAELFLEERAQVKHGYVQRESLASFHFKSTLVQQGASSQYSFTEARVRGGMSRHDLGVQQTGEDTSTRLHHFLLVGTGQLHDLHSKLELNHPRGEAQQLHKCIVSHATGRGVFDGSVKVNKLAQKSNASQLSRNLLLVPKATVNIKPNLQIIADDVKCTHGCAVSDLRDEELFYFRARGIDATTARQSLVFSFGSEVVQGLKYRALQARVQADVSATLRTVEQFALDE